MVISSPRGKSPARGIYLPGANRIGSFPGSFVLDRSQELVT
jgi:hypothetical protein